MSHMARHQPPPRDPFATDEGSVIRPLAASEAPRPRQASAPELKADAGAGIKRSHSSTRPAVGSLDDRLEQKMRAAAELMRDLPTSDSRVRLLYIAIMRRDEALLDGVLSELNKSPHVR
jgi:hypothetical protein